MTATTATPPIATAPAAATTRARKAKAAPNPKKVVNFNLWKECQAQARDIVGYKRDSRIYHATEAVILAEVKELLEDAISGAGKFTYPVNQALDIVTELQKRQLADSVAAQNYKAALKAKTS